MRRLPIEEARRWLDQAREDLKWAARKAVDLAAQVVSTVARLTGL